MSKKILKSKGVLFFSILIILVSIFDLIWIIDFRRYHLLFYNLPKTIVFIRYIFSILLRLILIISAIGVLFYKDIFRRIIIFISLFNIFTIYFKHPVSCFDNILRNLVRLDTSCQYSNFEFNIIKFSAILINYLFDIFFSLSLIYYFNRQNVKNFFVKYVKK